MAIKPYERYKVDVAPEKEKKTNKIGTPKITSKVQLRARLI